MSLIVAIGTAVPPHKHSQVQLAQYMGELYKIDEEENRKLKLLYAKSAIDTRYSVLEEFSNTDNNHPFFANARFPKLNPSIDLRLEKYFQYALPLSVAAIKNTFTKDIAVSEVTHLITVSCTGMSAPGLDIELVNMLGLPNSTKRSSVNFMGCYAAIQALQQADYICRADVGAKVLVVCVELCTLHFQNENTMDNWVANSLFADGAAAVLVVSDEHVNSKKISGFKLEKFYTQIVADGHKDMAWQISAQGFLMTLSAYIPQLIAQNLTMFLTNILAGFNMEQQKISNWAIHPGGRKILDAVLAALALEPKDLQASYETLKNYGNMSSPTVLFVLNQILRKQNKFTNGQHTFALAFGPGLVMESVLLKYVC